MGEEGVGGSGGMVLDVAEVARGRGGKVARIRDLNRRVQLGYEAFCDEVGRDTIRRTGLTIYMR